MSCSSNVSTSNTPWQLHITLSPTSPLYQKIYRREIPRQYHLVGDAAYALHLNLITPFKDTGRGLTVGETLYNNRHSQTRMASERAFGILKARRLKLDYVDSEPEPWNRIVLSCCVLHNMCQLKDYNPLGGLPRHNPELHVPAHWDAQQKQEEIMNSILERN